MIEKAKDAKKVFVQFRDGASFYISIKDWTDAEKEKLHSVIISSPDIIRIYCTFIVMSNVNYIQLV